MDKEKLRGIAILEVGNKIKKVDLPTFTETFELLYKVLTEQNSHKHSVMQAEVSDVSEGAAVGQRSVGTVAERGKFTCYEIHTVQARMYGCSEQCDECKARSSREGQP